MGDVTLRFSLLPPEHRVVVTSSDVKAATGGKYYLRTYDNSGGAYAKASDGKGCLLYTSPSPRDYAASRMPSSA